MVLGPQWILKIVIHNNSKTLNISNGRLHLTWPVKLSVIRSETVRHHFQTILDKKSNSTIKSPGAAGKIQNEIKIEIDAYITLLPTEGIILIN